MARDPRSTPRSGQRAGDTRRTPDPVESTSPHLRDKVLSEDGKTWEDAPSAYRGRSAGEIDRAEEARGGGAPSAPPAPGSNPLDLGDPFAPPGPAPAIDPNRVRGIIGGTPEFIDPRVDPRSPDQMDLDDWKSLRGPSDAAQLQLGEDRYDEIRGEGQAQFDALKNSEGYKGIQNQVSDWDAKYQRGGLTAQTEAMMAGNRADAEQRLRGQREADMANLAERGMTGGGAELAAQLGARGSFADRMSLDDLNAAAFAEEQALNALQERGKASDLQYGYDRSAIDTQTGLNLEAGQQKHDIGLALQQNEAEIADTIFETRREKQLEHIFSPTSGTGALPLLGDTDLRNRETGGANVSGVEIDTPSFITPDRPGPVAPPNAGVAPPVAAGAAAGGDLANLGFDIWGKPKTKPRPEDADGTSGPTPGDDQ